MTWKELKKQNSDLSRSQRNDWYVEIPEADVTSITVILENTVDPSDRRCRVNLSEIEYCESDEYEYTLLQTKNGDL